MTMNLYGIIPVKKGKIQRKKTRNTMKASARMQISTAFINNLYGEVDTLTEQLYRSLLGGTKSGR